MGSAEVGIARKHMHLSTVCPHLAVPNLFCELPLNHEHNSDRVKLID